MLAYNLNCWLLLFHREAQTTVESLRHTRLATARLRFLFVAAKIWRHAGRSGLSYSDHYPEQGVFQRLLNRLRAITPRGASFPRWSRSRSLEGCSVHKIPCTHGKVLQTRCLRTRFYGSGIRSEVKTSTARATTTNC